MEPTIYKPSIYKGAGIYKGAAGGGGGGGQNFGVFLLNFLSNNQGNVLTLELDEFLKSDNTISFSVIRRSNANNDMISFKNSSNIVCSRLVFDGSYAKYDNVGNASSYTFSLSQNEVYTFFIYRDKVQFYAPGCNVLGNEAIATYNTTNNIIKKVSLNTFTCSVGKIEIFMGDATNEHTNKIMSFVPFNDRANRKAGYINVMNGEKQIFANSYAY